ncbi:MAG TPA: glucuronate isomerase, partial [Microlunatus sp.]|nr:glucuronate isomerase [Microlunatus sp.]
MTASAATGADLVWPSEPRARTLAEDLYASVAGGPLVSVHNGLPARYLAEDLPISDPIGLLISHDQGIQALLRSSGIRAEFTLTDGWRTEHASRQAFVLLWTHLVGVFAKPWMQSDGEETAQLAGLPPFRGDQDPEALYDALAVQLVEHPMYPRRVLAEANVGRFATSDDPTDDLRAHEVLATEHLLAGRVVPTFSPDRYLDPARRGWRTDADLLAEVTGFGTDDLEGFLQALQNRRAYFISRGALSSEHHASDVTIARLPAAEAAHLYRLARSGELLPAEALALEGHLLWETARMAADDGLVMGLFPPAGIATRAAHGSAPGDRGVAARIRPLVADFGGSAGFRLQLFSIDTRAYADEILPLAAEHPALAAVPATRFADDPTELRASRVAAITAQGVPRSLGVVDDMSGP